MCSCIFNDQEMLDYEVVAGYCCNQDERWLVPALSFYQALLVHCRSQIDGGPVLKKRSGMIELRIFVSSKMMRGLGHLVENRGAVCHQHENYQWEWIMELRTKTRALWHTQWDSVTAGYLPLPRYLASKSSLWDLSTKKCKKHNSHQAIYFMIKNKVFYFLLLCYLGVLHYHNRNFILR